MLNFLVIALVALSSFSALADSSHRYLEENGYIHFATEDANPADDWVLRNDLEGFAGSGYLEWTGANYFSKADAGNGTIAYQVRIETPGNYEFRWRSRIAKGDSNTEHNDSWVRFSSGANVPGEHPLDGWTKVYMGEYGVWSWSSRTVDEQAKPVRQYFAQGDHTIEISGRSNGHAVDQIALYRYADVNFDAALNGTLPLSHFLNEDGVRVDPNPPVVPVPEIVLAERVNVEPLPTPASDTSTALCSENTLSLPALKSATLNADNQAELYSTDALVLQPRNQQVLLAFDLAMIPPFSTARLHYATQTQISNGAFDVYLGSHSDWPEGGAEEAPNASVTIAAAKGGWDSESWYATSLDASLLPLSVTTIILDSQTGSDALELANASNSASAPRLVVAGGTDFCTDWEANRAQTIEPVPPESEPDSEPESAQRKSGIGGVTHGFILILLAGLIHGTLRRKLAIR